jgi:hypothetical protein
MTKHCEYFTASITFAFVVSLLLLLLFHHHHNNNHHFQILEKRLESGETIHELSIDGAKHIGDGFLRTLADVTQQVIFRANVYLCTDICELL